MNLKLKAMGFLAAMMLATVATMAQDAKQRPLLVGHRGSLWGLENSVESFTNGAKKGYEYLETDFKLTKDKQFVCSHDDDDTRLGGTKTLASSTLEELQSETLSQTRSGVKYTGRLCSGQEYLDVCKEYGCRPLIELKWTTGINSNDCSNIPMLIKFIEDNGFRNKCIILTSMKPCLEYIRKNYPDIELQFLTGQYWANHFDWCVAQGIDVDIQSGYFDKACVQKFHDAGLKVNMWTANTNDAYRTYGNMGCDMITTDYLDPQTLPDLDASVTNPPNTVDYPNVTGTVKGSYNPEVVYEFDSPAFNGNRVHKALMDKNGRWVVLSHDSQGNPSLDIIDPATGATAGTYATGDVDNIGDIAMTADGYLVATNRATIPFSGGGETLTLYVWDNALTAPRALWSTGTGDRTGNWTSSLVGEHIAVSGRLNDLKLYLASRTASGKTVRIAGVWIKNGVEDTFCYALDANAYTTEKWGDDYELTVTPGSRDNLLIDSPVMDGQEYTFCWTGTRLPMESVAGTAALKGIHTRGLSYYRRATKVFALIPESATDHTAFSATLHDVTAGLATAAAVSPRLHPGLGQNPAQYTATAFSTGADGNVMLHLLAVGQGMASLAMDGGAPVEVKDIDLKVEPLWLNATTTGNAPANIDGTNAQQGTAANGLFYVNNCVDKKLYIFDNTGCLGSLPGGSGWGTARDDKGNIIIRDDKLAGATHTLLIYPAGITAAYDKEPLKVEITVPQEGQTNFINASGDVLGGTGHIWLFPNGKNAVNIVTLTNGAVSGVTSKGDLSINGSTAGYVVPLDDNTENFLYQVRTAGVYEYQSGENTLLLNSRPTTSAPDRNSTGGGAIFTILGNRIYAYNSGANYKGGFSVRNLTDNTVAFTQAPIGTLGYETGGNYSTFNWLIAEPVSDTEYRLYQYCPANGMGVYRVYDAKDNAVDNITVDNGTGSTLEVIAGDGLITTPGVNAAVYNTAGVQVGHTPVRLPRGLYIVTDGTRSAKVAL